MLGVILFTIAATLWVPPDWPPLAGDWPLWLQALAAIVSLDLLQWCVHKLHHGVKDGEMDWIVSFRFQWTEVIVHKAAMAIPRAWLGFSMEAMWIQAVVGTAKVPDRPPAKLGYPGMGELPPEFFSQQVWQLGRWLPAPSLPILGAALLGGAWLAIG